MPSFHASLNAFLNLIASVLLVVGYFHIKKDNKEAHKKWMLGAFFVSVLFLLSYLVYHYRVGAVPYPHFDWTRTLYFVILIPHIILAAVMVPFIVILLKHALYKDFEKHKRIAKFTFPIWLYTSFSGVIIYYMLYWL